MIIQIIKVIWRLGRTPIRCHGLSAGKVGSSERDPVSGAGREGGREPSTPTAESSGSSVLTRSIQTTTTQVLSSAGGLERSRSQLRSAILSADRSPTTDWIIYSQLVIHPLTCTIWARGQTDNSKSTFVTKQASH